MPRQMGVLIYTAPQLFFAYDFIYNKTT